MLDQINGDYQVGFARTDASGKYLFDNLPPGPYLVDVYEDSITTNGLRNVVPTTLDVQPKTLAAGEHYRAADFGYFVGAKVEGNVFHDDDRNGLFEAPGDGGLANISVTLTGTDMFGNPVSVPPTTTDADGHFVFVVPEGDYTLAYSTVQTTAAGYPDATTVTSFTFHAEPGEDWHPVFDFGVDNSGVIGDTVWMDLNANDTQDGEPGLGGVTVNLIKDVNNDNLWDPDGADNVLGTADDEVILNTLATAANGFYQFVGLADGNYLVRVDPATVPSGYTQTYDNAGAQNDHLGQGDISGGNTVNDADFGYQPGAGAYAVNGNVWNDNGAGGGTAGNGTKDGAEPGIPNVTVTLYKDTNNNNLYDPGEPVFGATTTDASGNYSFPGVPNGEYVVVVDTATLPSTAFVQTGDPDAIKNHQSDVTVNNANPPAENFGYQEKLGSITGTVCDGNGNGDCNKTGDPAEPAMANVTVFLTWAGPDGIMGTADDVVTATTTDGSGNYTFPNLLPGVYAVTKSTPAGYSSLADIDGSNPNYITVVLTPGQNKTNQDFEVDPLAGSIGDRVWLDTDGDGVQDIGEPGLPNVVVELKDGAGNPIDADPNTAGVQPTLQTTDSNGNYLFTGVPAGSYQVDVVSGVPAGLVASPGTIDPKPVTLIAGQSYLNADFGYTAPAASAVIGDYVWADVDADGIQDPGEAGIGGVTVDLRGPGPDGILGTGDDTTVATVTTDPDGSYLFTGVAPGQYLVRVSGAPLTGYTPTAGPQSEGATTSTPVTVAAGDVVTDVDFGFDKPALYSISDRVWYDADRDGTLDPGESGIGGVTVNLLDNSGNVIATVTSNPDGTFTFPGVPNGSYTIQIADNTGQLTNLQTTTPPASAGQRPVVVSGAPVTGANFGYAGFGPIGDTVFSDHNGNGVQEPGEPGIAGVQVKLYIDDGDGVYEPGTGDTLVGTKTTDGSGTYLFNDLPQGTFWVSVDNTQAVLSGYALTTPDASVNPPNSAEYKVTLTPTNPSFLGADYGYQKTSLADVSGTVWNDTNSDAVQGAGEPGIPGVTVTLVDASGNVVATTTTDRQRQLHLLRRAAGQLHRRGDGHGQRPGRLHPDQRPGRHPGHGGRDRHHRHRLRLRAQPGHRRDRRHGLARRQPRRRPERR